MSNEHRLDLEKDLRVWVDSTPPGGRPVVPRAVDMGNGLVAHMPERLFIQVATEATPETRRAPTGAQVVQLDENGERVLGEGYQNVSFEIGRQVVIDADTTEAGGIEIRSVTVLRPDGQVSARDLTKGLRLREWAEEGLRQGTRFYSAVMPTGILDAETWAVGREVAEKIRSLPAPRPGRPKPEETMPDVHARCLELAADGERPKSIHYRLIQEFGRDNVPKDSRTVRRWLEKVRATEEVHE